LVHNRPSSQTVTTPELHHPAQLLPEERHVVALIALGHPLKLIGYELGLSAAAISEVASRVLRKLRLRSRAELVALFSGVAANQPRRSQKRS
jgi:DNA-binding NarL/FixJ family response regulator